MTKKITRITVLFALIITLVFWQIYFRSNVLYYGVYFMVIIITYLIAFLLNMARAISATVVIAIGLVLSNLIKRDFNINELLWISSLSAFGVIVAFLFDKLMKER